MEKIKKDNNDLKMKIQQLEFENDEMKNLTMTNNFHSKLIEDITEQNELLLTDVDVQKNRRLEIEEQLEKYKIEQSEIAAS